MNVHITGSEKNEHGEISVFFGNENTEDWYYTHGTQEIGSPKDDMTSPIHTMWAWINHMRHKNWWTPQLEDRFRAEVEKYF